MNNAFQFYKRLKQAATESTDNAMAEMVFSLIVAALLFGALAVDLAPSHQWMVSQLVGMGMVLFIIAFFAIWMAQLIVIGLVTLTGNLLFRPQIQAEYQREENLLAQVSELLDASVLQSADQDEILQRIEAGMTYYHGPRVDWGKVLNRIRAKLGAPVPHH